MTIGEAVGKWGIGEWGLEEAWAQGGRQARHWIPPVVERGGRDASNSRSSGLWHLYMGEESILPIQDYVPEAKGRGNEEEDSRRRSDRDVGEDANEPLLVRPVASSGDGAAAAFASGADMCDDDENHAPKERCHRRSRQSTVSGHAQRASCLLGAVILRSTSRAHEEEEVEDACRHARDEHDDLREQPPVGRRWRWDGGATHMAAVDERGGGEERRRRTQRHQELERAVERWGGSRNRLRIEREVDLNGDDPGEQVEEARGGSNSVHHGGRWGAILRCGVRRRLAVGGEAFACEGLNPLGGGGRRRPGQWGGGAAMASRGREYLYWQMAVCYWL